MNKSKFNLQNTKYKIPNTNHGITLVALIITIIVLLILAMVSIRLVMNGGIIGKAESGTQTYKEAEIQEQIKLAYNEWQTARWDGTAGDAKDFMKNRLKSTFNLQDNQISVDEESGTFTVTMTIDNKEKTYTFNAATGTTAKVKTIAEYPTATPGTATTENSKFVADGKTAVIPAGYTVSSVATEQSIDTGLVITKGGNEWVWIPVSSSDLAAMYTQDNTGWTMSGTGVNGIDAVITKYKSNGGIISGKTRGNPGTTDYREPDVLNNDSYDKNATNLSNAGLGANIGDAATKLRDDYKAMIDSVKKNGGFYVGRYELSSAGTKKNQASLTSTNWYNLYKACKDIDSSGVVTTMIFGCQWDQVCKFITTAKDANGDTISLTDSRKYGNYWNSQAPANAGNYSRATKQNTGSNEAWKTNNIYDLAGNCWEWTQEANNTDVRAGRGGNYSSNGGNGPVTSRGNRVPTNTGGGVSSRPTLYIK